MAALALLELVLLATVGFAVTLALLSAVIYPFLRPVLMRLAPAQRAPLLTGICVAPLGGAAALTAICLWPSLIAAVWPHLDHCLSHYGHLHLCVFHPPAVLAGPLAWVVNGVFWGLVASTMAGVVGRARSAARELRGWWLVVRHDAQLGADLIPTALPFSAVIGLVRQRVILSTGLVDALPPSLLRVVLAHEAAHVRRRDGLRQFVAALLAVAHLPRLRRRLLADLALAAEEACDEQAAEALGDRLAVARAILYVERLLTGRPLHPAAVSRFDGSDVPARVAALLQPPRRGWSWAPSAVAAAVCGTLAALAPAGALHHWTETALGLLVG